MKIVVAMDSFKGSISAADACHVVGQTISKLLPASEVVIKPMADGGEGTADAMMAANDGRWIPLTVTGPLEDMRVEAGFAWFDHDTSALVEMAVASGLQLLSADQLNPMKTTTYGTGQLIRAAMGYGAASILLAVGGSATVDGGTGAAAALGWKFLGEHGSPVPLGGAGLLEIRRIVPPQAHDIASVQVLCDVDNPLCGEHGAARTYGPQKGATGEMAEQLEAGLCHLAKLVKEQLGVEIADVPGAGAAGGLAAGAMAFMNADIVSGIDKVMERSSLVQALEKADWVITGEGSFDDQSLRGKVVSGVCRSARKSGVRIAVIAGQTKVSPQQYRQLGITEVFTCRQDGMSLEYAMNNSSRLLKVAASKFVDKLAATDS